MKVVEMLQKKALVELYDESNYNVASLLLDKLAAAKSQVSPVLAVQAGNKIDLRKSPHVQNSREQGFRGERAPGRPKHTNKERNGPSTGGWNSNPPQDENTNDSWNDTTCTATDNWESTTPQQNNFDRPKGRFDKRDNFSKPQDRADRGGFRSDRHDGGFRGDRHDGGFRGMVSSVPVSLKRASRKALGPVPVTTEAVEAKTALEKMMLKEEVMVVDNVMEVLKNRGFSKRHQTSVNEDSWNVSSVTAATDAAPPTATYKGFQVVGTESNVAISWFHNPGHFYCQLIDCQAQFKKLMEDIQLFYKGRNSESSVVGAPVIGLFPEDNVLYRAQVLEVMGNQYKVFYVDFGNVSTINKIWPIEKKFMELPAQAIVCSLHGLKPNGDTWLDPDSYSLYFDKDTYICRFVDKDESKLEVTLYDNQGCKLVILNPDEGSYDTVDAICPMLVMRSMITGGVTHAEEGTVFIQPREYAEAVAVLLEQLFDHYENLTEENTIIPETDQVTCDADSAALIDKDVTATIFYGDNGWEGSVTLLEITPSTTTNSDTGFATSSSNKDNVEALPVTEVVPSQTEPKQNTGTQVFMSHVDSPNDFYLQLVESLGAIEELQCNLQEEVKTATELESPTAGVLCAAPYTADGEWYRAEVLDADDDITSVRFVDFGNTDVFDNSTTKMKSLPSNLLSLAVYATRCTVNVLPPDGEWSTAAIERFIELTQAEDLTAEFLDQDEKKNYENLAIPVNQSSETKITGFVSHQNSPSEFWIQLENCVDELEWIAEQLSTAETFPELEDHSPARVLSNTVAGVELLFIDYGNSCASDGTALRKLPEELSMTPPLAQKCSLKKPNGLQQWSKRMTTKFAEISAEDGKDVTSLLLPETETGHVKDLVGLDNFHIEKNGETLPDTFRLEEVNGVNWSEDSLEKFKDINKEGTAFQIEFLEDSTVCLYLDGRDIKYDLVPPKSPQKVQKIDPIKESSTDQAILAEETNKDSETEETVAIETETVIEEHAIFNNEGDGEEHTDVTVKCKDGADSEESDLIKESETSKEEICEKSDEIGEPHSQADQTVSEVSKEVDEVSKESDHTAKKDETGPPKEVNDVQTEASEKSDESVEVHAVSDEHPKDLADPEIATAKKPVEGHTKDVKEVEKMENVEETLDERCKLEQTEKCKLMEDSTEISTGLSTEGI
nr:unnamed protein product [Callosobruchus analis]